MSFNLAFLVMTSRSVISRKSLSTPRSWTSSMKTCETVSSSGSVSILRRSTPVVQNKSYSAVDVEMKGVS
eukprot:31379-Pelagococcus_subviridis.AAC.22